MNPLKYASVLALVLILSSVGCAKGPKGDAGISGRVVATMNCSGVIGSSAPVALQGLEVEYDAVLTATGDVYATASIIDEVAQISNTAFYASGQAGAQTASVMVVADFAGSANGGWWNVSLNRSTLVTSVVYTDSDLFSSPVNMTFTPSACTVQSW